MHVFFIGSPLQFLCAKEACEQFNISESERILIIYQYGDSAVDLFQTISLWERRQWPIAYFLPNIPKLRSLYVFPWLNKLISIYKGYIENIFIAHDRLLFRHFINKVKPKEVWLIDDGAGSLNVAKKRLNDEVSYTEKIKNRLLNCFGVKSKRIEKLNYFSSFPVGKRDNEEIIFNKFSLIKNKTKVLNKSHSKIILLGQPLIEAGAVSSSNFNRYLSEISNQYADKRIFYYAHRREDSDNLDGYAEIENIDVVRASKPIELEIMSMNSIPSVVLSFYSAALMTLPLIFGDVMRYVSYRVPEEDLLPPNYKATIDMFYEGIDKENVVCINLGQ